jgi:2-pyrone-4,6-dicarboxylate lactonase
MPSIGSRTTVVGVPAGVSSGAMVMPHPMPTRPVADPLYTFPEGTVEQYLALTEALGIERMVLVQPTFYGTDNSLLADVLKRLGPRCGGVVRIEEDTSDADLDAFHAIGVRAIRLDLFARAGWPTAELIGYIRRMAARATPRGWHLQFYTPGTIVRDLLPFLADLEDTFVIDHMGYLTESDQDLERRLLAVLSQGSCWIKLSGAYRVAKDKPLGSVTPWGRALVAARPDRLIWGSDWPHLPNGHRDTGEILNLLADWAPPRRPARQSWSTARPAFSSLNSDRPGPAISSGGRCPPDKVRRCRGLPSRGNGLRRRVEYEHRSYPCADSDRGFAGKHRGRHFRTACYSGEERLQEDSRHLSRAAHRRIVRIAVKVVQHPCPRLHWKMGQG